MFLKFKPYPQNKSLYAGGSVGDGWRDENLLECDEVKHRNWWVSNSGDLQAILEDEDGSWFPIWELPIYDSKVQFPEDGISLTRLIVTRYEPLRIETVFVYDCNIYAMSDEGKTVDKF
jgi:hypothetical protein